MDYKRIYLIIGILIFSIFSVNAVTTLNSCGKNSGWVNGETYYLNFSEIPSGYSNWCLIMPTGTYNNITLVGLYPINVKDTNSYFLLFGNSQSSNGITYINNYLKMYNISFYSSNNNNLDYFVNVNQGGRDHIFMDNAYFENVSFNLPVDYLFTVNGGFSNFAGGNSRLYNSIFNNFYGLNVNKLFTASASDGYGSTGYADFNTNSFKNSILKYNITLSRQGTGTYHGNYERSMNNNFNQSVIIPLDNPVSFDFNFYSSIRKGVSFLDANNDGVGDNGDLDYINPAIYLDLFNYRYLQDVNEGSPFSTINKNIVTINDENIGLPITLPSLGNSSINTIYSTLIFNQVYGLEFYSNSKLKNELSLNNAITNTNKMYLQDHPSTPFINVANYNGFILLSGNNIEISNAEFYKTSSANNGQMISIQGSGNLRDNISINNNKFERSDTRSFGNNDYYFKLKTNNLNVFNNTFRMMGINGYEILSIESTNKNSNSVYLNIFNSSTSSNSIIFTEKGDTKFYNNYISNNLIISNNTNLNLNVTPLIAYKHTDNKYYYFRVGNYYQGNVGCTDGNGDGFCDSSYTNGAIVDTHPLSSYPFNYVTHLLSAEFVLEPSAYNISLVNIIEGETIYLNDSGLGLEFSFSQNSDYIDLVCDYIVDGVSVGQQLNPSKNVVYNYTKIGGWTTKTYTFRVECTNPIQGYVTSQELHFNVIISGLLNVCGNAILENVEQCDDGNSLNGDGCSSNCQFEGNYTQVCGNGVWELGETCDDGNILNGDGCSSTCHVEVVIDQENPYYQANVIDTNSIENTTNNAVGVLDDVTSFIYNLGVPIAILLITILILLAVVRLVS